MENNSGNFVEARALDLDLIDPDPNQPRKNKPIEYLRELGNSIKERGLRNPIHVRENPEVPGKFLIVNGECRWTAACLVGLREIRADIYRYDADADAEVYVDQMMDNGVRKNLDPLEELQAYQTAIDKGASIEQIARAYGKKPDLIEQDLPILRLPEILLKAYDKREIPKSVARKLAELGSHKKMLTAWEWAKVGKNSDGMIKKIDAYKAKVDQVDLFDQAMDSADEKDKKEARVAAGKLLRTISEFQKTPFANGKSHLMVLVNSRKVDEMEMMAREMAKISQKIMDDVASYKARNKSAAV